jgi:hypothetical protein
MKQLFFIVTLLITGNLSAQIVGTVTDSKGQPLPYVNIYLEDTYKGTTSNEEGNYTLDITETGDYSIVFQFLGYTTVKKEVEIRSFPKVLNVSLSETSVSLDEVVISSTEDPAYRIIRETIKRRKENLERISAFTANFYSRGIWRVKDVPEKILGQDIEGKSKYT